MRRIANEVGVSATSLYIHYESKDALFQALVDEGMSMLHEYLESVLDGTGEQADTVDLLCRAYVDFGLENPEYYDIMFVIRPRHMERFPAEKYRRARRNLDLLVDALQRVMPGVSQLRLRTTATVMWASLHGVITLINARRVDHALDTADVIDEAIAIVVQGGVSRARENRSSHPGSGLSASNRAVSID